MDSVVVISVVYLFKLIQISAILRSVSMPSTRTFSRTTHKVRESKREISCIVIPVRRNHDTNLQDLLPLVWPLPDSTTLKQCSTNKIKLGAKESWLATIPVVWMVAGSENGDKGYMSLLEGKKGSTVDTIGNEYREVYIGATQGVPQSDTVSSSRIPEQ